MTREKAMQIMKNHGLYVVPLASAGIGLTDNKGNIYDVVTVSENGLIIDENTTMTLRDWLGY